MNEKVPANRIRKWLEIGWREVVGLPDLGIVELHAKIDTGARTSALHAVDLDVEDTGGQPWVSFAIPQPGKHSAERHRARVIDHRMIKNTSGVPEHRYVVRTTLVLGRRHWQIEVSLADREQMGLDMILGRTAIRGRRILVNPGRSFLAGPPRLKMPVEPMAPQIERAQSL